MGFIFGENDDQDSFDGTSFRDIIYGGSRFRRLTDTGEDTINGQDGPDDIFGGDGDDNLDGDDGNDFIFGGFGRNSMSGDEGHDVLKIALGKNTLRFNDNDGFDVVLGYKPGVDEFDLTEVDNLDDFDDLSFDDTGDDVLVDYETGAFLLKNTAMSSIQAGDFLI